MPRLIFLTLLFALLGSFLSPAQSKAATWSNAFESGDQLLDLSKLEPSVIGAIANHHWTIEPSVRSISIPSPTKSTTIQLNQSLPDHTMGVGLWIMAAAGTDVFFEITNGKQTITLQDGQLQGQPVGRPQYSRYSTTGAFKNWTLRRAHLLEPADHLILKSITIKQKKATPTIQLGTLLATVQGADPFRAKRVWKLSDFVTPKPSSIAWTAVNYYEYGFEADAVIRPAVFEHILGLYHAAKIRVTLTDSFARPLQTWWLDPAQVKDGLRLPAMPEACYYLLIDRFDKNGFVTASKKMVYQVLRDDALPEGSSVAVAKNANDPMILGSYVADGPSGQVGELVEFTLDSTPVLKRSGRKKLTVSWSVNDTTGMYFLHASEKISADKPLHVITVPSDRSGGYDLSLRWLDASGKKVDQRIIRYGIAGSPPPSVANLSNVPMVVEEHQPLIMDILSSHSDPQQYARLPQGSLPTRVADAVQAGLVSGFSVPWADFEPIPGCYQWYLVERYLSFASLSGKPVAITLGYAGDNLPRWLWFEELMSQNQQTIHAGYHYVTPMGTRISKAVEKIHNVLLKQYRDDWRVAAVHYHAGPSEGFLTDTPPKISDYNPQSRKKFQAYLARKYTNIKTLNDKWQAHYASFDAVQIPLPQWDQPYETSVAWVDFHFFKVEFVSQFLDRLQSSARKIDPTRILLMYGKEGFGPTGALAKVYRKNNVRYSNGGGETTMAYVQSSIMHSNGVTVQCEGHYVQPNLGSVCKVAANAILSGGFTGHNQMWGLVWAKQVHEMMPEYKAISQFNAALVKASSELKQLELANPWAGYFGAHQNILTSRSFRTNGNRELMALNSIASNSLHQPCAWVDDTSSQEALNRYPLIVDTHSKILTQQSVDCILAYVQQGGTFIASAYTGSLIPGTPAPGSFHTSSCRFKHKPADEVCRFCGAVPPGTPGSSLQLNSLLSKLGASSITASKATVNNGKVHLKELVTIHWQEGKKLTITQRDSQNRPLVYELNVGKGRFIITAGLLQFASSQTWLQEMIEQTAGVSPLKISVANAMGAVMKSSSHDYLMLQAPLPNGSLNAKQKQMLAAPKVDVVVTGFGVSTTKLRDILNDQNVTIKQGQLKMQLTPGMLYLYRWQR